MKDRYFQWLCEIVGREKNYSILLDHLHRAEFYFAHHMDANRAEDGKELRTKFLGEMGVPMPPSFDEEVFFSASCSVLEMIVALSMHMAEALDDCPMMRNVDECFWILIGNLGLTRYNDLVWIDNDAQIRVENKLKKFLDRKYTKNGVGGLFPLDHTENNLREIEIWYQMAEYLISKVEF